MKLGQYFAHEDLRTVRCLAVQAGVNPVEIQPITVLRADTYFEHKRDLVDASQFKLELTTLRDKQ